MEGIVYVGMSLEVNYSQEGCFYTQIDVRCPLQVCVCVCVFLFMSVFMLYVSVNCIQLCLCVCECVHVCVIKEYFW